MQHDLVFGVPDEPIRLDDRERDLRRLVRATRTLGAFLAAVLTTGALATPVGASGILPPSNPLTNVLPSPNFLSSGLCTDTSSSAPCTNPCVRLANASSNPYPVFPAFNGTPGCTQFVLRAINNARSDENLAALVLPTNWFHLKPQEQIFVIVDLERTSRGLPPYLGLNRHLHAAAQMAANAVVDPTFASGFAVGLDAEGIRGMGGAYATGYSTLEADYIWMYDDGWGGSISLTPNLACTFLGALGCWGHRDQLLGSDVPFNDGVGLHCTKCEMGTGFSIVAGTGSFTSLVELPARKAPPMYFTWSKNVAPFLPASEASAT